MVVGGFRSFHVLVTTRFEFIKVCLGRQRLCWESQSFLYFVNKIIVNAWRWL